MICAKCGGNVHSDRPCDGCGITYTEMIDSISHDAMRKLIRKSNLSESEEEALANELKCSSFLVPVVFIKSQMCAMAADDELGRKYILLFTDREEYDKNQMDIKPLTNPFHLVLELLDERFEGFVININSEAYGVDREFLNKHFAGE